MNTEPFSYSWPSVDNIHDTRRKTCLISQFSYSEHSHGAQFTRFHHNRVTARYGPCKIKGYHCRKIEWRQQTKYSQRFTDVVFVDTSSNIFAVTAFQQFRDPTGMFHILDRSHQFALCVRKRFTMLQGYDLSQLVSGG